MAPKAAEGFGQQMMTYPATGWRRWVFKSPIALWRLGLGPLIGRIMLLITATGRKSGLPRRTMVEYHAMNGRKYVTAAFGKQAQWVRNIEADPRVTIQSADGAESVYAVRVTDDDELREVYALLMQRNPVMMNWYLESLGIAANPTDLVAHKDRLYILRFDPTDAPTPPPLEADLRGVWIGIAVALGLGMLLRGLRD